MLLESEEATEVLAEIESLSKKSKVYALKSETDLGILTQLIVGSRSFYLEREFIQDVIKVLNLTFTEYKTRQYDGKQEISQKVAIAKLIAILPTRKNIVNELLNTL